MAKIIKWLNGEIEDSIVPKNGTDFKLDELTEHVGCISVQPIYLNDGSVMWIDENGKFFQPENYNAAATKLLVEAGGLPGDYIVGDAFICKNSEVL